MRHRVCSPALCRVRGERLQQVCAVNHPPHHPVRWDSSPTGLGPLRTGRTLLAVSRPVSWPWAALPLCADVHNASRRGEGAGQNCNEPRSGRRSAGEKQPICLRRCRDGIRRIRGRRMPAVCGIPLDAAESNCALWERRNGLRKGLALVLYRPERAA